ncbi:hypothetical protein JAAARDRAFT_131616 [Jaapia argillacea MUCL 33604]|uniref:Nitrogen permease regulator 3 n=1 Tax=Jaapia argillacea MUCL 33604 TaxID=933084 RepID=A0A067PT17_9AGAM|nr:hypothetical protein JAAARDRAFT_131616 [Jaapia argillacea MUCL 33604]
MAESLLALLLVTSSSSAKGSSLVYRWPPSPTSSPRLARPRPPQPSLRQVDNPWRAIDLVEGQDGCSTVNEQPAADLPDEEDYVWKRAHVTKDRTASFSQASSVPASGRNSPSKEGSFDVDRPDHLSIRDEYDNLFGYSSEFLAGILCPQPPLCHQKFELIVDDLVFIGHPVCRAADGTWRFTPEGGKSSSRGRGPRSRDSSQGSTSESTHVPHIEEEPNAQSEWLDTFHFVIVLSLPDPSSSASGNVLKYFDILYKQLAFTVTAVLFQEQVISNFVERECEVLGSVKEDYISKGEPFDTYARYALQVSSIAPAMKTLYESVKSRTIAQITIHNLALELQLPPYLDSLLYGDDDGDTGCVGEDDVDEGAAWGGDMSFAWRLPALAPWKALLLLDGPDGANFDPSMNLRGPHMSTDERKLAMELVKFLTMASPRLQLADMAIELDWDLETQLYPIVRWLVYHRRAKVIDVVHDGLKSVFTVSPTFTTPLSELTQQFELAFSNSPVPPLPRVLSAISAANGKQVDNHFFATVVRSRDLIPIYHDVVEWMLKRDLLITLHLRIRIVATSDVKQRARLLREVAKARRESMNSNSGGKQREEVIADFDFLESGSSPSSNGRWLSLSPKSARRSARQSPTMRRSTILDDEDDDGEKGSEEAEEDDDDAEDDESPSLISDPGRAAPLERSWLAVMSEGKEDHIRMRFERINQYFDGKKTDDEILYRAEISRRQLREVLHHYDEHLQTFLHPS